jgi:hypothetical protein
MFHKLDQKRTYGAFWHRKFMREDGRPQRSGVDEPNPIAAEKI